MTEFKISALNWLCVNKNSKWIPVARVPAGTTVAEALKVPEIQALLVAI